MSFRYLALILCAIIVLIFLVQMSFPSFTDTFVLVSADAVARPWILVTAIFLHGSTAHLLGNMFALGLFGSILEKLIGWKRFLVLFFASGIAASAASVFFYTAALGASGAIFGILGALAALRPKMMVWTYGVPMPMFIAAGFWLLLDVAGAFFPANVANIAHIAGLIFGIFVGIMLRDQKTEEKTKLVSDSELDQWEKEWM